MTLSVRRLRRRTVILLQRRLRKSVVHMVVREQGQGRWVVGGGGGR